EPAMAVAGHREPLPPRRPAQRQMPRRRRLRHRRRGRHPAVHLRLRHQPAVVPYSVLGAHTMRRPALTTAARLLAVCTLAMALIAAPAHASNPLVHRFAADPSMHVYNNRVYVYTTDDESNSGTYWDSDAWRVYSSSDLVNWTDHGAPFSVGGFAWATRSAWAPSAAQRNVLGLRRLPRPPLDRPGQLDRPRCPVRGRRLRLRDRVRLGALGRPAQRLLLPRPPHRPEPYRGSPEYLTHRRLRRGPRQPA